MASLMLVLARCMRRYDANAMLVLADLCEEREWFESARKIRNLDTLFIAYLEMYRVRRSHRRFWPCDVARRFPRWSHNPKPWKQHTQLVCIECGTEYVNEGFNYNYNWKCGTQFCNGHLAPIPNSGISQPYQPYYGGRIERSDTGLPANYDVRSAYPMYSGNNYSQPHAHRRGHAPSCPRWNMSNPDIEVVGVSPCNCGYESPNQAIGTNTWSATNSGICANCRKDFRHHIQQPNGIFCQ